MAALPATSLTAGLLILEVAAFSLVLALVRANTGIHYGNGAAGKKDLTHLVRAQGNLAEYAPLLILGVFLSEYNELLATTTLSTLGVVIALLRLSHALQLANPTKISPLFRMIPILSTLGILFFLGFTNAAYGWSGKENNTVPFRV